MRNRRVFALLGLALFAAFMVMTLVNAYRESREGIRFIRDKELPTLGLAAAFQLENAASRYKTLGEELLRDGFIRDWLKEGEIDAGKLRAYLEDMRKRYGLLDASIVSDPSETYYGSDGRVLRLSPDEMERDGWYYLYRESAVDTNIDSYFDAATGILGIYVNVPIRDRDGSYLGVAGGGIDAEEFGRVVKSIEKTHDISIFMARRDGRLVYATDSSLFSNPVKKMDDLWTTNILDDLRREQMNPTGIVSGPSGPGGPIFWGRYLRDWDTFLVVERSGAAVDDALRPGVLRSLAAGGFLAISVFLLNLAAFKRAYERIDRERSRGQARLLRLGAAAYGLSAELHRTVRWIEEKGSRILAAKEDDPVGREAKARGRSVLENLKALDSLRAFAQDEEGAPLPLFALSLNGLLQELLLKKAPRFASKGITAHTRIGTELLRARGNAELIRLALDELIEQAIASVPAGAEILVSARAEKGFSCVDIALPSPIADEGSEGYSLARRILDAMGASLKPCDSKAEGRVYRARFPAPEGE